MMNAYERCKQWYASYGVDTEHALKILSDIPISVHCWQGDDVTGFERSQALSGGIQATGNYPGKATCYQELMNDLDKAFSLIPGRKKLNLHACYAIFENGEYADRDQIKPCHFKKWVDYAKERNLGIDFNPTMFSHPMAADNLTLSSPNPEVRAFWINHCKQCIRISEYFAQETGMPCVMNIWIPDGYKNAPADRIAPRARFRSALDEILSIPYDKTKVYVTLESKVFGIGLESYTVGSSEFCLSYAKEKGITPLLDNGHYHPTELVSDKISALLLFHQNLALHLTHSVRWDSDHVVLLDDEIMEIAREVIRSGALHRIFIATDYFDASINRVAAWVIGVRNVQKALLHALLEPSEQLKELQESGNFTKLMIIKEELKTAPFGDVFSEYLRREQIPLDYYQEIESYEQEVLTTR